MSGSQRPLGRRRRRLYWTVGLLATCAVLGSVTGLAIHRASRAVEYRPGEKLAEITRRLDLGLPDDSPTPIFIDVTPQAGLDGFRTFAGERTSQLPEDMGSGAAWGDFDGDGDDDLFLVSQGGPLGSQPESRERSRLYENRGDGTFAEVAGFPETRVLGMGAAWGDHDGDGDLDLVLTGYDTLRLFRNDSGSFVRDPALQERPGFWSGASWSDFDGDGDLDLYVCGYIRYAEDREGAQRTTQQYGRAVPYTLNPASFEPASNLLLRNDGRGGFDEVATALGVANVTGRSLGALWHDMDQDGRVDLYVANDVSDNAFFLNRIDGFADVSHPAWVADYRGAMGLAVGDWNRDGDDDLFISHWIAQENALYDSLLADSARRGQPRELRFVDVADQVGLGQISLQFVGWGAEFADLDSDGWLDLVVANGSTFETGDRPRRLREQPSFLFWNRAGRSFHDLAPLIPALSVPHVSRGLALSDYDSDGDVDLLFVDRDAGVRLLRNDTPQGRRIALRLLRPRGAPIEGTQVTARIASGAVRRAVGSVSYLSQSSRVLHLGLGEARRIDELEVRWPDGTTQSFNDIEPDGILELVGGALAPRRIASWAAAEPDPLSGERLAQFWNDQRAAMNALKLEGDCEKAIGLFLHALELDPHHADSLYYLANCLAETGNVDEALVRLGEMMRLDPRSHRAHKRWGSLRAATARNAADLDAAVEALERGAAINPEETGVSLVLGEVELLRGNRQAAEQRLEWVVGSNPQAGEAYFVLAYIALAEGNTTLSTQRLRLAAGTRGKERKPSGVVAEGEVRRRMHVESTPFEALYEAWDGSPTVSALEPLRTRLARP